LNTLKSTDGRYEIHYHEDLTGYVQIVEYAGFAPRVEVRRSELPCEMLSMLMDKLLFGATSTGSIMTVEPSPAVLTPVFTS